MILNAANKINNMTKVFLSTRTTTSTGFGGTAGFQTIGCVGLGLMGHGICQVAASSGIHSKVIAYEKEQRFLDAGYVHVGRM
jgi:phosphoglycerate dehydrogenase-like enzyme